jgi:potassium efflux system protein
VVTRRLWRGATAERGMRAIRTVTIAIPIALAVASIAGYHYTALQLALRSIETTGFVVGVYALHVLCSQWARVVRQTPSTAIDRDESGKIPLDTGDAQDESASEATDSVAKPATVSAQVQRLVRLGSVVVLIGGVIAIWSSIVPALKLLHSVKVWPYPVELVDPAMALEEAAKIVTLAGVLAAIGIAVVTLAAARNVRGALELTLLRHVPLDAGARYAVAAICRYVIALVGLLTACSCVGIGASQLNWLVAAMTVGLGFGLQEIFANFVSGLILLFERPVRIGDIVSVEGVTGSVTRIRIRATTITDGDMRELIVPNKELITGRVINWTLSNTVARMTISVRTAHGVDPDKARNLLLAVATQHPLVLKQPPPQALFDEFTDKTQNFTLRVFMANCDVYPQLRHELLTSIQRTFRQAGIGLNSSDAASLPVPVLPPEQRAA